MSEQQTTNPEKGYELSNGSVYDLIYSEKDYAGEAAKVTQLIQDRLKSDGNALLEAACGTGTYMALLAKDFEVEGFDLEQGQVNAALAKLPNSKVWEADMVHFDAGKQYDAIVCLFSSIGYVITTENLKQTISNFSNHLKPGGVVIIEPWLKAENFKDGNISTETISNEKVSVQRMGHSTREGIVTTNVMHYMVGTERGVDYFVETHKLSMFSDEDFIQAFDQAGLHLDSTSETLSSGRGLYIAIKPTSSSD